MEQDPNLQNQEVDPQRNLVTKLINHYEPNVEVTDDYYKSISEKYQDVDTLVTKLINHYEPKSEVTTDYLNGLYGKYGVKKKEQTKPTQAAPLPGLGGVSEEPTPSPSVGQGVLRNVDQTQPRGEAFISRASDLTRTDVREPQVDGEDTGVVDIKLSPKDSEYIVDGKKVDKTYFKDFLYERDNSQAIFDGIINISVKNDPEMEQFALRQVQSRETNDVWDSLKSGVITIGSSVLGAQQMVGDFLEDLTGIQPTGFAAMEKTAREAAIKDLQEKAKESQESRFQADGDFIDLVSNGDFSEAGNMAVNTVVESGPLSLTALAATVATGNPMAGFAVLAPITTGMTYSEQMTTEDEAIKNLSDTEKYIRATAFGLAEAGSEAISGKILGRSFKLFGKGVSDMVGRVASEFGEQAATDIAISSAKKTISEIMKNYGLSMAEEGAAEGLTQLTQNLTDAFLGVRDMSLEQVLEGVGNAIALGTASGGIMSTPGAAGQAISGVSKKVLDYKLSKKNGAEELTSEAKRMAEFNKIFADNLSDIESNIESRSEAVNATPKDMVSDTETVDLVEEKQKLEKEIEGKDPILTDGIKKRVGEINEELKKKAEAETVPAKQKGRLTKFSTPQDGIVGEVTYEDGTKKELTQEEYDALEKQEGLFDVETGTQPVAETPVEEPVSAPTEVAEEAAPVEGKLTYDHPQLGERGFGKRNKLYMDDNMSGLKESDIEFVTAFNQQESTAEKTVKSVEWSESGVIQDRVENAGDILRELSSRGDKPDPGYIQGKIDILRNWVKQNNKIPLNSIPKEIKTKEDFDKSDLSFTNITDGFEYLKKFNSGIAEQIKFEYEAISTYTKEQKLAKDAVLDLLNNNIKDFEAKLDQLQEVVNRRKKDGKIEIVKSVELGKAPTIKPKDASKAEQTPAAQERTSDNKKLILSELLQRKGRLEREQDKVRNNKDFKELQSEIDAIDAKIAEIDKLKEGEIDITTVFKNPVEKNNEQAVSASNEFKDKAGEYDEGVNDPKFKEENTTVEEISVDDIIPTQERLFEENLKSPSEGEPLVMKIGDKYYVEDGHHRIGNEINADNQTVSVRVYESDKAKQDAVQKQAAGKVPVQPEAKAGEKVEEGKPKTEPEKPTQEGKEVSEEEKVKAAKDKLSSAWEKWKQSQNNLGIAFDPKSKANEDMELLEAFLSYIKALGIKTAKDIQKAFNDFTGGEATLDDAGAEFIANKVNPKKGETNYEKTEDMNRKDLSKRGKSLFNAAKKLFMDFRRTFVKFSSDTRELLKSTTDIRPVYDYFVARLGSPGNANLIFQEAKKKIYDGIFPNLRKHLDSLIKYRRIITINESRVESNRKGLGSLKASEIFEKAGDEAVNAFNEAVSLANDYANSTEQQALDARGIRNEALRSLRQSEWYKSLSELKQKRFEKQLREDLGFLKNENFTGKDSNGNPIGLSVAREMLSEIEVVVGKKDFNKINERAELYFDEFKKMLEKDLKKGIISQEQYDAMIGKDYSPRVFIQHMFGFDGEFIENIDEARLMKEYSLSSDAIRTLREGLKDLNTNEAYWELITDSEKLLAGYISSRERRYAFNDLNTKMVSVLSKFEAEFNELKKKEKFTKEERLRYKKLGNILDAFSTERKRGMSSANYYENGEKKSFYIRDDIFKQWYDMRSTVRPDGTATKLLDNLFQIPQRILQSFATGEAAPFFFVFNTARDFVQLSVISDVYGNWTFTPISMAKAMKDFAKGAYHIFMDDALYREAMENGVGMDFLYMEKGLGLRKMMKDSLLKLAEKSDITRVGSMALTKGIDAMSSGLTAANRYSELGFRIAIYERVRGAEYKKIEAAKDKMTDEEYLEAKQDARKKAAAVSRDFMNFSEGGSFTKKANPYASYLNAAVIGADTVVKEFRKNPLAFTFRVAQGTTILSTAMLGMGLMMLNMFDEDDEEEGDDKDKQYGTLKKYYKILDSVSPYYRNKFYIIPTGRKDENGNYEVIRIAKNPALIPISYAAEKALRYNLEKQLLGSEERYSSENLKKDALEINYLFHEYVMPINLSPVDENGDTGLGLVSNLVQKNIPLSLMMIAMTGYDPYTNRYISPEKKYQSELDSKYLIGWNDPEIQGFYKDMAMELNTSITPKEMKVMVEKIITRPENNPIIASVYSMLDRNNKTSDIIKKDRSLVSDILNMTKKVAVISADYEEYAKKPKTKKIEEKIREHKEEKYVISKITKTVLNDIIEKVKDGKIDALDADGVIDEMNKMVSTQIDVFKEVDVEVSEKDENEIRHKIYRNAVPVLKLPQLPTQYKLAYVVDKDPVVMAYRFFEDFGDVDVNDRQFIEISAQMMNEYTAQYNSKMSKDKFSEFLNKYIEAKNDPELIGN
jgi:hypothetical protein